MDFITGGGGGETKSHKVLELDEVVVSILHQCLLSALSLKMRKLKLLYNFCTPLTQGRGG